MKRQRGSVTTWVLFTFVMGFGSATATTPALTSQMLPQYITLAACLEGKADFEREMAIKSATPGLGRFEYKAFCVKWERP